MNKKNLTLALGGAIASGLLSVAPSIQAGENPFAMSSINPIQVAEAIKTPKAAAAAKRAKVNAAKANAAPTK